MSNRLALARRPSSSRLLAIVLDEPELALQVSSLAPRVLGALISQVGLEDAGELVALATTDQLVEIFDEDLWRSERVGQDESFDAARFLVWLEVMMEAGEAFVADKLVSLPQDLVTLAFHRQVLVLELEALRSEIEDAGEDGSSIDKALESCLGEEIDDYQIVSRNHDGWDVVLAALLALDRDHHAYLVRLLERCCRMSAGVIDDAGGLYEVLTAEEMLESDAAGDREDRRAEAGFVAPSDARAFLGLAAPKPGDVERDPMTRAYFRRLGRGAAARVGQPADAQGVPARLLALLSEAGVIENGSPKLPASRAGREASNLFFEAMRRLEVEAPATYAERREELAYLANVLVSGHAHRGRRLRPIEALQLAVEACERGIQRSLERTKRRRDERALEKLRTVPADVLFRLGFR